MSARSRRSVGLGSLLTPLGTLLLALGLAFPAFAQDTENPSPDTPTPEAAHPEAPQPAEPAPNDMTFSEVEVREGLWYVTSRTGPRVSAMGGSLGAMMHAAQLTVDAGKTYFHVRPHGRGSREAASYEIEMWDEPPEGAHVHDRRDATTLEGSNSAEFLVYAAEAWLDWLKPHGDAEDGDDGAPEPSSYEVLRATRTVEVDELGLTRRRFAPDVEVGGVRSMAFDARDAAWPAPVFVSETLRVLWFGVDGALVAEVALPEREPKLPNLVRGPTTLVPYTPRAGEVGFLATGGGWQAVGAYSADGALLWQYDELPFAGRRSAPDAIAAGDLDGDGAAEFVLAGTGGGGLSFLDERGRIEHGVPGLHAGDLAILDLDGDGALDVLYEGPYGFGALDADGEQLRDFALPERFGPSFDVVPGRDGSPLLAQYYDTLHLTRPDGGGHEEYDLPGAPTYQRVQVVWWRRAAGAEPLLVVSIDGEVRAHLYVLASDGAVLHHELLGTAATSGLPLVTLPRPDAPDALLVGTHDGLWLYEFADAR